MTTDARALAWRSVERLFAASGIPAGSPFPVILGITVKKEDVVQPLQDALAGADLEPLDVTTMKGLFRRRWLVTAKAKPRPIAREDIDRWLDDIEPMLKAHAAELGTWFPLVPDELLRPG